MNDGGRPTWLGPPIGARSSRKPPATPPSFRKPSRRASRVQAEERKGGGAAKGPAGLTAVAERRFRLELDRPRGGLDVLAGEVGPARHAGAERHQPAEGAE